MAKAMFRLFQCLAALMVMSAPAVARPVCHIVIASDQPSAVEILRHEMAHCWGWEHPEKAAPKKGENYQAYKPPLLYRLRGEYPNIAGGSPEFVTTREAKKQCDGHWGCMWFD